MSERRRSWDSAVVLRGGVDGDVGACRWLAVACHDVARDRRISWHCAWLRSEPVPTSERESVSEQYSRTLLPTYHCGVEPPLLYFRPQTQQTNTESAKLGSEKSLVEREGHSGCCNPRFRLPAKWPPTRHAQVVKSHYCPSIPL